MNKKYIKIYEPEQSGEEPVKKRRLKRRLILPAIVLLLALVAGLIYAAGGELSIAGAYRAYIVLTGQTAGEIVIPEGFGHAFADVGGSVIAAGELGVAVIGPDGAEVTRELISLPEAAVVSNGKVAAVFSAGGRTVLIASGSGVTARITEDAEIRGVCVGSGGEIAVGFAEFGDDKGAVKVYRINAGVADCVYEWYTGTDYVLSAAVSDDGKTLAALTISANGGRIAFYNLDSIYLSAETTFDEAVLEISYMKNGELFARTRSKLYSVARNGAAVLLYDASGYDIGAYSAAGGEFAAIYVINRYGARLVTVDTRGRAYETDGDYGDPVSLRICDGHIALLTNSSLTVFRDRTLVKNVSFDGTDAFTDAFPRSEVSAIAIGARAGIVYK